MHTWRTEGCSKVKVSKVKVRDGKRAYGAGVAGRCHVCGQAGAYICPGCDLGDGCVARRLPHHRDDAAGGRAKAHHHDDIDTVGYIIAGESLILYGEALESAIVAAEGDYFFIPSGMPHAPLNRSAAPCTFVVAHAAGDDQEGIVMRPDLDAAPIPA